MSRFSELSELTEPRLGESSPAVLPIPPPPPPGASRLREREKDEDDAAPPPPPPPPDQIPPPTPPPPPSGEGLGEDDPGREEPPPPPPDELNEDFSLLGIFRTPASGRSGLPGRPATSTLRASRPPARRVTRWPPAQSAAVPAPASSRAPERGDPLLKPLGRIRAA